MRSPLAPGRKMSNKSWRRKLDQLGWKENAQTYQINAPNYLCQTVGIPSHCKTVDSNYRLISFQRGAAHLYVVTKCLKYHYEENATEWVIKKTRKHIKLALQTTSEELVLERAENGKSSFPIVELFCSRSAQPTCAWSQNVWETMTKKSRPAGLRKCANIVICCINNPKPYFSKNPNFIWSFNSYYSSFLAGIVFCPLLMGCKIIRVVLTARQTNRAQRKTRKRRFIGSKFALLWKNRNFRPTISFITWVAPFLKSSTRSHSLRNWYGYNLFNFWVGPMSHFEMGSKKLRSPCILNGRHFALFWSIEGFFGKTNFRIVFSVKIPSGNDLNH